MTEDKDPKNCPFFEKTGCCSKGKVCMKIHRTVEISRVLLFHHLYPNPEIFLKMLGSTSVEISQQKRQNLLDGFFVDVCCMLMQFGQLDDLLICGNKNDTLFGNVLAEFHDINAAKAAQMALDGVFYAGRKIHVSFTPILRLISGLCFKNEQGSCMLGDACCFIHPIRPTFCVYNQIFPRKVKSIPRALRSANIKRNIDHPMDLVNGKAKFTTVQ